MSEERSRKAAKGWLSRVSEKMESLCAIPVDKRKGEWKLEASVVLGEFDKRLAAFDDAQAAVEVVIDEEKLLDDIQKSGMYRDSVCMLRARLAAAQQDEAVTTSSRTGAEVNLPKLNLPTFDGNVERWLLFWESFDACVHSSDLPDIQKLSYLRSLLKGEAAKSIGGLALTAANYGAAIDILKKRYGRPEKLVFLHIQSLLNLKEPNLVALQDSLLSHIRSLEALDVGGDKYGVILTPLVLSKLPEDVRMEWARTSEGHEGDLCHLLEFLNSEIRRRERSGHCASMGVTATGVRAQSGVLSVHPKQVKSQPAAGVVTRQGSRQYRCSPPAAAAALSASAKPGARCGVCSQGHLTAKCHELAKLSGHERHLAVRNSGLCFRCLMPGHRAAQCGTVCANCNGEHHAVLCYQMVRPMPKCDKTSDVNLSCTTGSLCTLLPTAQVTVKGAHGDVRATVLFDTGSNMSYVSSALVRKCAPELIATKDVAYSAFGGSESGTKQRNIYCVEMSGAHVLGAAPVQVEAAEVPVICNPLRRPSIPDSVLAAFGNLELADRRSHDSELSVDILIGLDNYWDLMMTGCVRSDLGPVAQQTVFGWVLSGATRSPSDEPAGTGHQLLLMSDVSEARLRQFWELDAIGICPQEGSLESDPVLVGFESSVCFKDGRYEVELPWKPQVQRQELCLEDNRQAAEVRLHSLSRKLGKDPQLQAAYDSALEEMETEGIISEVSETDVNDAPVFYLPHRPVVRASSSTTKVRPVFDASAKGPNLVSLNDCLESGPCLLSDLVGVLIRFRRWRFAVTADIRKAFLMIRLCPRDQNVHRFLWNHKGKIRTMKFLRVTFGVNCSPFLLAATIRHHLKGFPPSNTITELEENMYVDDLLSGADTEEEACALLAEAREVLGQAGMELTKLGSNSSVVLDKGSGLCPDDQCRKVLGVKWDPTDDAFLPEGVDIPTDVVVTKRVILSFLARMFDPLGLLTPYVMTVKRLFQETWRLGLDWDQEVPEDIKARFLSWLAGLSLVKETSVPRSYCAGGWDDVRATEVHVFSDASEAGYGAVVYLRLTLTDGSVVTPLVMSRARVAPLKRVTLPRLELLGALLAARLLSFVLQALKLPPETRYRCWTDSTIVLCWIRGEPTRWKQFVRNRVSEIHNLTDPAMWAHCPGRDNPADLVTRGVFAAELTGCAFWFSGPDWLREFDSGDGVLSRDAMLPEDWESVAARVVSESVAAGCVAAESVAAESVAARSVAAGVASESVAAGDVAAGTAAAMSTATESVLVTVVSGSTPEPVVDVERFSSLTRAVRIVGLVLKFVRLLKCRSPAARRKLGLGVTLSDGETREAQAFLIRVAQTQAYPEECAALGKGRAVPRSSPISSLCPFVDDAGLIRVRSRLTNTDMSLGDRCPVLVPKGHLADLLIRFQHERLKHSGVDTLLTSLRCEYWIVGVRRAAKRVKRTCLACQRQDAVALNAPVAPLPAVRTSKAPPFAVTGVDFCGPLFVLPKKKVYVCLFTCAVTRAVHLELVDSLALADFLLAFRRFCARRGTPSTIYSDNARTFSAASVALRAELGAACPEWKFIAPRAAWWGGWWERLVRSVKSSLRKTLGKSCLTRVELETCLIEVEACVNSRPLTFVGDEPDGCFPLTPSHFLSGRLAGTRLAVEDDSQQVTSTVLRERDLECKRLLAKFWAVWQGDYLRSLPHSVRKFKSRGRLQVGSVVLIHEEGLPRMRWVMGVVCKLHPGSDGVIRAADVRTAGGVRTRAVQRLHDLEMLE